MSVQTIGVAIMIDRVPEPEVMESAEDAAEYDAMDHSLVNAKFVEDFDRFARPVTWPLDVGTGTALIPITLCRALVKSIVAVDASAEMLAVAKQNLERVGLADRVTLKLARVQSLPFADGEFHQVISNSLLHHLPNPADALPEMVRVCRVGGSLFVRDLARPDSEAELEQLVQIHAKAATPYQRRLFSDSLRASLTLEEFRAMVVGLGFAPETVTRTSDRHLTWAARRD